MKKLLNKLLISIIIIVLLFNFIIIPSSQAISLGGILLKPFTSLLMVPLDVCAFMITMLIGVTSNGAINWLSERGDNALSVIKDSWANDENLIDNAGSAIETATTISGMGFLSMEDFFRGDLEISNINIFENMPTGSISDYWDDRDNGNSVINAVKIAAAGWYYSLRNIAAVGLLCVLIYTAIRIMLTTIAEEKAAYKDRLVDWVKATCLVIFAHVLMIVILHVTDLIVEILGDSIGRYSSIAWVRHQLLSDWDMTQVVYLMMYGVILYYTVCFAISYMKRFLYTILLIIIAPVVSLVYAFGKQGKEIFQKWLKEFVLNALLQPYHMLIYTVMFGFVATIADTGQNIFVALYSLIVLHFIRDAEKYYRALFGMDAGVAGIGQVDTGMKTMEKVKEKVTKTITSVGKVALSVATLGIPVAGAAATAANAATASQAANAADKASDMSNLAGGFRGGNPPGGSDDIPLLGGPTDDPNDPLNGPGGPNGPVPPNPNDGGNAIQRINGSDVEIIEPDVVRPGESWIQSPNGDLEKVSGGSSDSLDNLTVHEIMTDNLNAGRGDIGNLDSRTYRGDDGYQYNQSPWKGSMVGDSEEAKRNRKNIFIASAMDSVLDTGGIMTSLQDSYNAREQAIQERMRNFDETPEEARKNYEKLALDEAINGTHIGIGASTTDIPQGDGRPGVISIEGDTYDSDADIKLAQNTKQELRNDADVKLASVSSTSVTSEASSEKELRNMIKETLKDLPDLPSNLSDRMAEDIIKNLDKTGTKDIDMKELEGFIKNAISDMGLGTGSSKASGSLPSGSSSKKDHPDKPVSPEITGNTSDKS